MSLTGHGSRHHPAGMFVVSEAEAAAIRTAFEQQGELSAAGELRRLYPGVCHGPPKHRPPQICRYRGRPSGPVPHPDAPTRPGKGFVVRVPGTARCNVEPRKPQYISGDGTLKLLANASRRACVGEPRRAAMPPSSSSTSWCAGLPASGDAQECSRGGRPPKTASAARPVSDQVVTLKQFGITKTQSSQPWLGAPDQDRPPSVRSPPPLLGAGTAATGWRSTCGKR